jgi:hypothetical protein
VRGEEDDAEKIGRMVRGEEGDADKIGRVQWTVSGDEWSRTVRGEGAVAW